LEQRNFLETGKSSNYAVKQATVLVYVCVFLCVCVCVCVCVELVVGSQENQQFKHRTRSQCWNRVEGKTSRGSGLTRWKFN